MDSDGSRIICLVLLIFFVILKAFYAACEYAVIEAGDSKIKALGEKELRFSKLVKLLERPGRLIVTFSMGKTISTVMIAVLSVFVFCTGYEAAAWERAIYIILTIIVVSLLMTSLTDVLPKKLVSKNPENFAASIVMPVKILMTILAPLSTLTYGISSVFCRIMGIPVSSKKDIVTEEEILMMVDAGNETGVIEESQKEMINNIFEFGDAYVSDVMKHRKEICAVNVDSKICDIVYLAINRGYSRIPVYEETIDNIIGIIYVKDLLCLVGCEHSEDFTVRQFMRKVMFVPETGRCKDVFEEMTRKKAQMAVVADEYGGTAGMITMEDLLEEIVGNIQDEYDDEAAEISEVSDGVFIIAGDADPEDVENRLGFNMPENHNYDTMSAFIVDLLGRIPNEDETPAVEYDNIEFTVLISEDNWISKIKAECHK